VRAPVGVRFPCRADFEKPFRDKLIFSAFSADPEVSSLEVTPSGMSSPDTLQDAIRSIAAIRA
jgi:hypothetical protein